MAVSSIPAQSPVAVCSRALILVGAEPITSFDDGNNEALIASNMYEDVARSSLLNTRWRFSTNQAVLNRLSDALFVWSRWTNKVQGFEESIWNPNYSGK